MNRERFCSDTCVCRRVRVKSKHELVGGKWCSGAPIDLWVAKAKVVCFSDWASSTRPSRPDRPRRPRLAAPTACSCSSTTCWSQCQRLTASWSCGSRSGRAGRSLAEFFKTVLPRLLPGIDVTYHQCLSDMVIKCLTITQGIACRWPKYWHYSSQVNI